MSQYLWEESEGHIMYSIKITANSQDINCRYLWKKVDIYIGYNDNTVFCRRVDNVLEIRKAKMFY